MLLSDLAHAQLLKYVNYYLKSIVFGVLIHNLSHSNFMHSFYTLRMTRLYLSCGYFLEHCFGIFSYSEHEFLKYCSPPTQNVGKKGSFQIYNV